MDNSKKFSLALTKRELWEVRLETVLVGLKCQAEEFGFPPSRWEGSRPWKHPQGRGCCFGH